MTSIEIEVPRELAQDVDDLRGAITEFLEVAARGPDVQFVARSDRVFFEAKLHPGASDRAAVFVQLLNYLAHSPAGLDSVAGLLENISLREDVLRHVTDAVANQPLPVGPATAAQIASVDQAWREIESRYGALDAGEYAELVGASPKSRSTASKARGKGLVGYRRGRRILYPRYQFDQRGIRSGWSEVVAPLRNAGWDDEDIVLWLAAPNGALGRRSPIEALDNGERDLVLRVVEDQTSGVW